MGRLLPSLGLLACLVAFGGIGCGGGTDYSDNDNGTGGVGTDLGATPTVVSSSPLLGVEGARGEIAIVASPNATPAGLDDFTFLQVSGTRTLPLNYPSSYTLLAPEIWADRQFKEWRLNGNVIETDNILQLSQIPSSVNGSLRAVYEPYVPPAGEQFEPNYAENLTTLNRFPVLPIRIWIDPLLAPNEGAEQLLRNGLDKWVRASGGVISYVEVESAGQADIRMRSVDNLTNLSEILGNEVLGVNLSIPQLDRVNNDLDFSTLWLIRAQFDVQNAAERRRYEQVVAHEFGHALGLQGHSALEYDLMFPFVGPNNQEVTENDINTVATAYREFFNGGNTVPGGSQP